MSWICIVTLLTCAAGGRRRYHGVGRLTKAIFHARGKFQLEMEGRNINNEEQEKSLHHMQIRLAPIKKKIGFFIGNELTEG